MQGESCGMMWNDAGMMRECCGNGVGMMGGYCGNDTGLLGEGMGMRWE